MGADRGPRVRRDGSKEDKRRQIMDVAGDLFAEHGVRGVTMQQIADSAGVAIGTLYLYVATKAELLIMVQNQKFATAIEEALAAIPGPNDQANTIEKVLALLTPVVACLREQPENGRTYLHELVFGDPAQPHRAEGLTLSLRLEDGLSRVLARDASINRADAIALARVVIAIVHGTTTATVHLHDTFPQILARIRLQVSAALAHHLAV